MPNKYVGLNELKKVFQAVDTNFVKKEANKGLSTNDYTTAEKQKLAGLANYSLPTAASDTLGGVKVGTNLSIDGSGVLSVSGKGSSGGFAELDANGKVPATQLPSYVDDVIDGYYDSTADKFYEDALKTTEITGESGKIYIDLGVTPVKTYRYSGSVFAQCGATDLSEVTELEVAAMIAEVLTGESGESSGT